MGENHMDSQLNGKILEENNFCVDFLERGIFQQSKTEAEARAPIFLLNKSDYFYISCNRSISIINRPNLGCLRKIPLKFC